MTMSPLKNVPDVGVELGAACMPSGHASDQAGGIVACVMGVVVRCRKGRVGWGRVR